MWANFATTLGATLHEIGHCFGLPHTTHGHFSSFLSDLYFVELKKANHDLLPKSIMLRGFDNFNRWAMITEPGFKVRICKIALMVLLTPSSLLSTGKTDPEAT